MNQHTFKYLMGQKLKDKITGFEGIVVYRVEHITGCDNYGLQPQGLDKDGNPKESKQFDENRLEPVGKKILNLEPAPKKVTKPGGQQPFVGKSH